MTNHDHSHQHTGDRANIRLAFLINLGFTIFEIIGGLLTNSIAILSDSLHDAGDSISLGLAWLLDRYSNKGSDTRYSYGYRRFSLLGALINSAVLIVGSLFIVSEALGRLANPESFDAPGMVLIAIIGVAINGLAVLRLRGSRTLNAQVMAWHLIEDVLGWIAVLAVGIVSLFADIPILDPILSILITVYILAHALGNLKKALSLFLQAIPSGIDIQDVDNRFRAIKGVESTHHTHIWSLDGEHHVLTTHLVVPEAISQADVLRIKRESREAVKNLGLEHTTIEIEYGDQDCSIEEDDHHQAETA